MLPKNQSDLSPNPSPPLPRPSPTRRGRIRNFFYCWRGFETPPDGSPFPRQGRGHRRLGLLNKLRCSHTYTFLDSKRQNVEAIRESPLHLRFNRPLAKFFKAPQELNIYSSGLPLLKGDGRGIIRGVGGINPFFCKRSNVRDCISFGKVNLNCRVDSRINPTIESLGINPVKIKLPLGRDARFSCLKL